MRVLFDHNVDRRFRKYLPSLEIKTTREMGWTTLENGRLLRAAADAGFDVFICIDKNIEYQQNLLALPLPVMIIDSQTNALPQLIPFAGAIQKALETRLSNSLFVIHANGTVESVSQPRKKH